MSHRSWTRAIVAATALSLALAGSRAFTDDARDAPPLPTESSRWVGEPQSWESLRGKVTLVFVWTFG